MALDDMLTRREFLKGALAGTASALAGLSNPLSAFSHDLTRREAVFSSDEEKQHFIDKIVRGKGQYYVISVEYATPNILKELKEKFEYEPNEKRLFEVFPVDLNQNDVFSRPDYSTLGRGTKSKIYVFNKAFYSLTDLGISDLNPEAHQDVEDIVTNSIIYGALVQAMLINNGIPGYPIHTFKNSNGEINFKLYFGFIELLSESAQYEGLINNPRFYKRIMLRQYASKLMQKGYEHHNSLLNAPLTADMDKELTDSLRKKFDPRKLFKPIKMHPV